MAVDISFMIYKVVQRHIHNSLCEKPFTSIQFYMSAEWSFIQSVLQIYILDDATFAHLNKK